MLAIRNAKVKDGGRILVSYLFYNLVMHTSFNLPDYDEHSWSMSKVAFPFNIDSIKSKSPTLPLHFDRSYLPSTSIATQKIFARQSCSTSASVCSSKTFWSPKSQRCVASSSHTSKFVVVTETYVS